MRRILKWTVVPIASVYLLLCLVIYLHQSKFIFIPQREVEFTPRDFGCDFEDVRFESGGKQLHGWWIPADAQGSAPGVYHDHQIGETKAGDPKAGVRVASDPKTGDRTADISISNVRVAGGNSLITLHGNGGSIG